MRSKWELCEILLAHPQILVQQLQLPNAGRVCCNVSMLWFGWQVGRLRIQIFGFAMVGTLFMVSAIWYHPLTTRGGLGTIPISQISGHLT